MFENMSFDYILNRAISNIPNDVDKRQGSIIYDAIAPCCMEIANIYKALDEVIKQTFADTADREYIIKRAKERGLYPKEASCAVMKGVFNIDVPIGSRFYIDSVIYFVSEKISDGVFKLTCETKGSDGHRHFGTLLPLDNIEGLELAQITDVIVTGEDDEDTEVFRKRYLDSFSALAFGGNKKDYIEKVCLISGVGGCKVFPAFFGGGTVKLVIISSDFTVVSDEFIFSVKEIVDPFNNSGQGEGFAPIGHKVTVESVKAKNITVNINLEFSENSNYEFIKKNSAKFIKEYFKQLSKGWADCDNVEIVAMKIGSEVFEIDGVKNVLSVTINSNNSFESIALANDEIPVLKKLYINGNAVEGF